MVSEGGRLLRLLATLPLNALLLDAGFTGYDLLAAATVGGRSFLIRVDSNARLLTKLGRVEDEFDGRVYVTSASSVEPWPEGKRKGGCEPLVLLRMTSVDGRNRRMHLLTDVPGAGRLNDATSLAFYGLQWGAERLALSLKQTLGRRKLLSDCPARAAVKLDWAVVELWVLDLTNAEAADRRSPGPPLRPRGPSGRRPAVAARWSRPLPGRTATAAAADRSRPATGRTRSRTNRRPIPRRARTWTRKSGWHKRFGQTRPSDRWRRSMPPKDESANPAWKAI